MSKKHSIRGLAIHKDVFRQLVDENLVVEYQDHDFSKYFNFKPSARRALLGLREPKGFNVLHQGVSQK